MFVKHALNIYFEAYECVYCIFYCALHCIGQFIYSFIPAISIAPLLAPVLLRGAPDYSTDTELEFHAEAHRQLQVKGRA